MQGLTGRTSTVEQLWTLARSERADALADLVVAEFRATLLMDDDERLATDASFFELGFTSLLLLDVKLRLEHLLGAEISANALFNRPTVDRLLDHLTTDVLIELFGSRS